MFRKIIYVSFIFTSIVMLFPSCYKDTNYTSEQEGTIYMPQAYEDRASLTLYKIDSVQSAYFGIAYGGFHEAASDITATFEIDSSLIDAYNAEHQTSYITLPQNAFTVSGLSTTMQKGATSSAALSIDILTSKLTVGTKYMLPIKLVSVSPGTYDADLSIAWFRIDSLTQRTRDVTLPATLTVSNENSGGSAASEGSSKLIDGNTSTKFYTGTYVANDFWLQLQLGEEKTIHAYTLTSGNDASSRDPKTWQLQGSNDGTNWTTLDSRTDYTFLSRNETVSFELNSGDNKPYLYYRLFITANNGSSSFQMSEWRLIQYY